jgi:hypothetical protein
MASYKARLRDDLEAWIAEGLVPAASREAILARVAEPRRLEASQALAAVGGLLLGVAVIAFVAANWNGIPRIPRFGLILTLFLAACAGGAWAGEGRPVARNIAMLVASLVFAAAIGLTGQIFDLTGDPVAALRGAGLAAFLLALAGRSSGAAVAGLVFLALGDTSWFNGERGPSWLILAAPTALVLAQRWRSKPLAHGAAIALPIAVALLLGWLHLAWPYNLQILAGAVALALLAAGARRHADGDEAIAGIVYGWSVWAALVFFAAVGFDDRTYPALLHRVPWLALSGAVVALGLNDRKPAVTAAGVVSMAAAMAVILNDLGMGLMAAAGVFAAVAVAALVGGFLLGRRTKA